MSDKETREPGGAENDRPPSGASTSSSISQPRDGGLIPSPLTFKQGLADSDDRRGSNMSNVSQPRPPSAISSPLHQQLMDDENRRASSGSTGSRIRVASIIPSPMTLEPDDRRGSSMSNVSQPRPPSAISSPLHQRLMDDENRRASSGSTSSRIRVASIIPSPMSLEPDDRRRSSDIVLDPLTVENVMYSSGSLSDSSNDSESDHKHEEDQTRHRSVRLKGRLRPGAFKKSKETTAKKTKEPNEQKPKSKQPSQAVVREDQQRTIDNEPFTFVSGDDEPTANFSEKLKKRSSKALKAVLSEPRRDYKKEEPTQVSEERPPTELTPEMKRARDEGFNMLKNIAFPALPAILQDAWVYLELLVTLAAFVFAMIDFLPIQLDEVYTDMYLVLTILALLLALIDAYAYLIEMGSCTRIVRKYRSKHANDKGKEKDEGSESKVKGKGFFKASWIEKLKTYFELGRNIVSELILYPLLIFDLFDFITDVGYRPGNAIKRADFSIFLVGSFYLFLAVYIMRIVILCTSIFSLFKVSTSQKVKRSYDNSNSILIGFCIHVLAQIVVHFTTFIVIGAKINNENPVEDDFPAMHNVTFNADNSSMLNMTMDGDGDGGLPHVSPFLWIVLLLGWIMPMYGVVMFFPLNIYWLRQFTVEFWLNMVSLLQGESFAEAVFGEEGLDSAKEQALKFVDESDHQKVKEDLRRYTSPSFLTKFYYPLRIVYAGISALLFDIFIITFLASLMLTYKDGVVSIVVFRDDPIMTATFCISAICIIIANFRVLFFLNTVVLGITLSAALTVAFSILLSPFLLFVYFPVLAIVGYCFVYKHNRFGFRKNTVVVDNEPFTFVTGDKEPTANFSEKLKKRSSKALKAVLSQPRKDYIRERPSQVSEKLKKRLPKALKSKLSRPKKDYTKEEPPQVSEERPATELTPEMKRARDEGFNMLKNIALPALPAILQDVWVYLELLVTLVAFALAMVDFLPIRLSNVYKDVYLVLTILALILALIDVYAYLFEMGSCVRIIRYHRSKLANNKGNETEDGSESEVKGKGFFKASWIEKLKKYFELGRNIVSELILYPLLIFDLFDFITEVGYKPTNAVKRTDFSLFLVGSFYLFLAVYIMRIVILCTSIFSLFKVSTSQKLKRSYDNSNSILTGFCIHVLAQIVVHFITFIVIGAKINNENPIEDDLNMTMDGDGNGGLPHVSPFLWIVLVLGWIMPMYGIVMFFPLNIYWLRQFTVEFWLNMVSLLQGESFAEAVFGEEGLGSAKEQVLKFVNESDHQKVKEDLRRYKTPSFWTKFYYPLRIAYAGISAFLFDVFIITFIVSLMLTYKDGVVSVVVFRDDPIMTATFCISVICIIVANVRVLILLNTIVFGVIITAALTVAFSILVSPLVLCVYFPLLTIIGYSFLFKDSRWCWSRKKSKTKKEQVDPEKDLLVELNDQNGTNNRDREDSRIEIDNFELSLNTKEVLQTITKV